MVGRVMLTLSWASLRGAVTTHVTRTYEGAEHG